MDGRGKTSSKSKELRTPEAALSEMDQRIHAKRAAGFSEVFLPPDPPTRWELARFDDGRDDFPVDTANAMITDLRSAEVLGKSAELRGKLERAAQGPPGCAELSHGKELSDVAWFGAGPGDGRYQAFWGETDAVAPSVLVVPFSV